MIARYQITWAARRLGPEDCYVIESHDGDKTLFGPMPSSIVDTFIRARREMVSSLIDRHIAKLNQELLHEDQTHQAQ